MNLLTPENIIILFISTISLTIIFLLITNAYFFRELHHLKVIFSYTLNTIKKLDPEFGTESHIEKMLAKFDNEK
ncbi:hypothetical protein MSBR3_2197 [Methanosarcina barkeri 3]|uniref:Uncharacterized protein n=1 Tax=Methanosarcina barkeri 3 TaxID=1434107 RepID=A0A0E3WWH3_METBA|nr:hypothetical protein [Methanosarcina sp.]AKB82775.1 hypothetical protein MSBR3_2197 [Methanosarcina barkeri 3]